MRYSLWILLLLLVGTSLAQEIGTPPIFDPSALPGFSLNQTTSEVTAVADIKKYNPAFDVQDVFIQTTKELWTTAAARDFNRMLYSSTLGGTEVLVISATRVNLGSTSSAQRYFNLSLPASMVGWRQGSPSGAAVGEQSYYYPLTPNFLPGSSLSVADTNRQGQDGFRMLFRKGSAVVEFQAHGYGGRLMSPSVAESAARTYVARLSQPTSALSLTTQVISKHVKPHKDEKVQIRISSSSYPVEYSIAVTRGSSVVYRQDVTRSLPFEFVWNGYRNDGQPASNGSHTVTIFGRGSVGSDVKEAQVNVNF